MEIRFTRGARTHRIGKAHAFAVMFSVEPELVEATEEFDARLVWVGEDSRGVTLHIVALILEDLILVIHVMPDYRGKLR